MSGANLEALRDAVRNLRFCLSHVPPLELPEHAAGRRVGIKHRQKSKDLPLSVRDLLRAKVRQRDRQLKDLDDAIVHLRDVAVDGAFPGPDGNDFLLELRARAEEARRLVRKELQGPGSGAAFLDKLQAIDDFLQRCEDRLYSHRGFRQTISTPSIDPHRHPSPPEATQTIPQPHGARRPNETTEQPVIDALHQLGAIGVKGLQAIPKGERPTGERLATKAIGRSCDGQFKGTLAHMVDLGWLGNGRDYSLGGGYFLTEIGVSLVTWRKRSGLGQD
jgi:hypothetical protein